MMQLVLALLIASTAPQTVNGDPLHLPPWTCDYSDLPPARPTSKGLLLHPDTAAKLNKCIAEAERMHIRANARINATRAAHLAGMRAGINAAAEKKPAIHGNSFVWGVGTGIVLTVAAAVGLGLAVR